MEVLIVSSKKVPNQYMNPSYPEPENFNQLSPAFNPKDVFVINNSIYASYGPTFKKYNMNSTNDLSSAELEFTRIFTYDVGKFLISDNGKYIYTIKNKKIIERHDMDLSFNLENMTMYSQSETFTHNIPGFYINNNGSKLYIADPSSNIKEYDFGTNYDLSSLTHTRTVNIGINLNLMTFEQDGSKIYYRPNSNEINSANLTTNWDLSTIGEFTKIIDININIQGFRKHNNKFYFSTNTESTLRAITHTGTLYNNNSYSEQIIKSVYNYPKLYFPFNLQNMNINDIIIFNDKLYVGNNQNIAYYDTCANTKLNPDRIDDTNKAKNLTLFDNKLYYTRSNNLEYIDSSNNKTVVDSGKNPYNLIVYNNKIYFNGNDGSDRKLYNFDGSNISLIDTSDNNLEEPSEFQIYKDELYFSAHTDLSGIELWKCDSSDNLYLIKDFNPGTNNSNPKFLTEFKDILYFSVLDSNNNYQLWQYDNINEPTIVYDFSSNINPQYMTVFKDKLYFSGEDNSGTELWSYDGINIPQKEFDILDGSGSSNPKYLFNFDDKLFFGTDIDNNLSRIWAYDGIGEPYIFDVINVNKIYTLKGPMVEYGDKLFFAIQPNSIIVYDKNIKTTKAPIIKLKKNQLIQLK